MEDQLKDIIREKLNQTEVVNSSRDMESIIRDHNEEIYDDTEHREKIFEIFERVKRMGINIEYNREMDTETLEEILRSIKI